jgi:hypothetical protein
MMLDKGSYYLLNNQGDLLKLRAPYVSEDSLKTLGNPTSTVQASLPELLPNSCQSVAKMPQDPESTRVIEMFRNGTDITEITKTVYGVKTGRAYTEGLAKANSVIRQHLA